jgi:hypothetical protein
MKLLRYFFDIPYLDSKNNLFTWALSHNFELVFDSKNPDIVISSNDLDEKLLEYKNSKIIYYTGEPFLSWSGDINRNVIDKALTNFDFDDPLFDRVPLILHYNYEYFKNGYINDYEFLLKEKILTGNKFNVLFYKDKLESAPLDAPLDAPQSAPPKTLRPKDLKKLIKKDKKDKLPSFDEIMEASHNALVEEAKLIEFEIKKTGTFRDRV